MRACLLIVGFVAVLAIGCGRGGSDSGSLSGKVTVSGAPTGSMTLVVTGPDGKTSGGMTNDAGEYKIPSPPKGVLEFQFIPPASSPTSAKVPVKYTRPKNGVKVEYRGGNQVENIDLKP